MAEIKQIKKGMTTTEFLVFVVLLAKSFISTGTIKIPDLSTLNQAQSQVVELAHQLHQIQATSGDDAIYWIGGIYIVGRVLQKIGVNMPTINIGGKNADTN